MTGIQAVLQAIFSGELPVIIFNLILEHVPVVLFLELLLTITVLLGLMKHAFLKVYSSRPYYPRVTCLITCYNEGLDVQTTIRSLSGQTYPGIIDLIVLVDGAEINKDTLDAARALMPEIRELPNVHMLVIPKKQRGGVVSSLNLGLALAEGEIVMALDGDTSFDPDMVANAARHFADPNVVAVGGTLRVRNRSENLCTMCQGLEYLLGIHATRAGLSSFNVVNTISGAFGVFRTETVRKIGGWSNGSSQDLDLTFRMNAYFGRYRKMRMVFDPDAIGHTNVPDTWQGLFRQRMRWDGDLVYIYLRKRVGLFRPKFLGWKGLFFQAFIGLFISIVMPILTMVFLVWAFYAKPFDAFSGWLLAMYLYYFVITVVMYVFFMAFLSERFKYDLVYIPYLVVYPVYALVLRAVSAVAIIWNIVGRSHLDSSMAPWWVLRRGKY